MNKKNNRITEQVTLFEMPREKISSENAVGFSKVTVLSRGSLGLYAQRILRICASQIKENDATDKVYTFSIADFAEIYNLSTEKIHSKIKNALLELVQTAIILPIERGRITSYIAWGQIYDAKVEISFDPVLKPFYQKNLSGKYPLQYIRGFAYSYTYRFYELFLYKLKETDSDKVKFYISIEELRQWLKIEKAYKNYADIRKRIIVPVVADINGEKFTEKSRIIENDYCNLQVSYEEVKEGRKVIGINFEVIKKENMEIIEFQNIGVDEPVFVALSKENQIAYEAFKKWRVASTVISEAYAKYGPEDFYKIYLNVKKAIERGKVKNKTNYAAQCLRNNFKYEEPVNKEEPKPTEMNPEIILETQKIEERIANMTDEEKAEVIKKLIEENQNSSVTLRLIKGKTFDEITQNFLSKKLLVDFLRNEK